MKELLAVGCGGAFGAVARYLLSGWLQRLVGGPFPVGTLAVNVIGSFLIGLMMALADRGALSDSARLLWVVGGLGALTTFSTFGYETIGLLRQGHAGLALLSVAANVAVACAAVLGGAWAARWLY